MALKERLNLNGDPLFLVDGHAFLYRFFYAYHDMRRTDGFPTNVIFMFLRMMFNLANAENPTHAAFFFDGKGPTFRHLLFKEYKAKRPQMPEELKVQIDHVLFSIKLMGFPCFTSMGCEADDTIAALCRKFSPKMPVIIVGVDKDLKQCLADNVFLYAPGSKKKEIFGLTDYYEEVDFPPELWPDFQALMGDSSDNIPGVPKIGPKTALQIMEQYPRLESLKKAVLAGEGKFTNSVRRNLLAHIDDAFLYRELTRLGQEVPTHLQPEHYKDLTGSLSLVDLQRQQIDIEGLDAFMQEFQMRTLMHELQKLKKNYASAEVSGPQAPAKETKEPEPQPPILPVQSKEQVQGSLFSPSLGMHVPHPDEQIADSITALPVVVQKVVGLVQVPEGFILGIDDRQWRYIADTAALAVYLKTAKTIVTADRKFFLRHNGRNNPSPWWEVPEEVWFDLSLAAYLLSPEERNYSWEYLTTRLAPEILEEKIVGDGPLAVSLYHALTRRLQNAGLKELYEDMEAPLVPVLARMEGRGVRIDKPAFHNFLEEVSRKLTVLTGEIYAKAGKEFNLRSSQQMGEVLFTDLGLKPRGKTPGGTPSTSFAVLEKIKADHPIIETIQRWRKLEKMRSTYLAPLPEAAGADGRIHCTFNQLGTATGRLSSSGPNMQNIPIRGEMGLRMRSCFIADSGNTLVGADYSQIELRVLAHFSKEKNLCDAFFTGEDIHTRTAALLFDTDPAHVTTEKRRTAKTINFGLIYGMGPQKMAGELGMKLSEAKEFIARYFKRLPSLADFYTAVEEKTKEHGFVTTLAGRRRVLTDINSRNNNLQAQARRQAINTLIQGSAADIIKAAMLAVENSQALKDLKAELILQVHDELLLECPEDNATDVARHLEKIMVSVYTLKVPLAVDYSTGKNWAKAH